MKPLRMLEWTPKVYGNWVTTCPMLLIFVGLVPVQMASLTYCSGEKVLKRLPGELSPPSLVQQRGLSPGATMQIIHYRHNSLITWRHNCADTCRRNCRSSCYL